MSSSNNQTPDTDLDKTGLGGIYDWIIASLILISVISFSLETLPDLKQTTRQILYIIEVITISIFCIEYIYRIYRAKKKLGFIFSFYGIIDLLAILPFFLAPIIDLRAIRLLRFLRYLRLLKLVRYNRAIILFSKALSKAKEELIIALTASLVLIYLSSVGIYYFEHTAQPEVFRSIFDSLWWAVATLTTVGYGEIYPITPGGRIFTMVILMLGLGLTAAATGIFSSALLSARNDISSINAPKNENQNDDQNTL